MSDVLDAYNSIREDGGSATVTLIVDQTVNPLTGTSASGSDTSVSTYAVQSNFQTSDIDGSLVKFGDCKLMIPSYGLDSLSVKDNKTRLRITFGSETWKVNDVKTIAPYGVDILYIFHARK